jgi:hypothetical protein
MNFPKTTAIGISIASAVACAALVFAQEIPRQRDLSRPQAVETSRDSRMTGIMAVRLINTAESRYKYRHGTYATWDELLRSGEIDSLEKPATPFQGLHLSAGPEVTSGWMLSLVTAANGQSYELSLRNTPDPCAFSFFSDQRGLIYQGGVIDCSIELKPAS